MGWDRIGGKALCPGCQESIVQGDGEPFVSPTFRRPCSACRTIGSVTVQTFPHEATSPLEMDLCPVHLRGLLSRKLSPSAFVQLRQHLSHLGFKIQDVFLLHDAFYDVNGRALKPAADPDV
jgi:hypothetical protein